MTQEHKDLLLKDLCARLPYGVKIQSTDENIITLTGIILPNHYTTINGVYSFFDCCPMKPYLFPLSSMTEEQKQEYTYIVNYISPDDTDNWKEGEFIYVEQFSQLTHFYHINHLDYMGLIPMGLAEDATGLTIY
jgi:hypothetical protein